MNKLVTLWRELVEEKGSLADGIREMNECLDARYTNSRVNQWQDERIALPKSAARYMLGVVLPGIIEKHDISKDKAVILASDILDLIPS